MIMIRWGHISIVISIIMSMIISIVLIVVPMQWSDGLTHYIISIVISIIISIVLIVVPMVRWGHTPLAEAEREGHSQVNPP